MEAETADMDVDEVECKRGLRSTARFAANWRLVALTQLFGESQKAGKVAAGFLDLAPTAFPKNWWNMEDMLALQHEQLASMQI
jgi:hypothetical protein